MSDEQTTLDVYDPADEFCGCEKKKQQIEATLTPDDRAFYREQEGMIESALKVAGFGEQSHPYADGETFTDRVLALLDDETRDRWEERQAMVADHGGTARRKLDDYADR